MFTCLWKKFNPSINVHVSVDLCMDVCIDIWIEKTKINRVLNEICTQLIFAARFMWSYSLGEPNT
jgi:hypothetical protein